MRFAAPEWIRWMALVLVPLAALTGGLLRRRQLRLAALVHVPAGASILPGYSIRRDRARLALRLLACTAILLALSRPQWGIRTEEVASRGLDILVVLDTSRSMLADDLKPNRLQQAQWALRNFAGELRGDRIGLIPFAGGSFLYCPLTSDYAAFLMTLNDVYAGIIPQGGTAIEQALRLAVDRFEPVDDTDRVIILITDGEDHEGNPLNMIPRLRQEKIRVFTVGAASADGALIPVEGGFLRDSQGHVVKSRLNESVLRELAAQTGGFYVRAAPGDFGLDRILETGLSGLRRGERDTVKVETRIERYGWFAGAALLLLLAEGLLRPSVLIASLFLLLTTPSVQAGSRPPGHPESSALHAAEKWAERVPDKGQYNLGHALYQQRRFEEAQAAFAAAAAQTRSDRLRQKALYNQAGALLANAATITDPGRAQQVLDAAEKSIALYEQSLVLDPTDAAARRNLERALGLVIRARTRSAEQQLGLADQRIAVYEGRAARQHLDQALDLLSAVRQDFAPNSQEARDLEAQVLARIDLLDRAIRDTRYEIAYARQAIDLFEYQTAAQILASDNPARHLAFDLDESLQQEFEALLNNNREILSILMEERP